jgi:hypothetical protein
MDYQGFANLSSLKDPKNASNPLILTDIQLNVLNAFYKNNRTVVCKSRQVGASTTILFYAICHCFGHPGSTVALIPPAQHFGRHYVDTVRDLFNGIPNPFVSITNSHINFHKGGHIEIGSSPNNFRGMNIDTFIADEFASHQQDTEIYDFIRNYKRPVKEIYVSTPSFSSGEFHNLWNISLGSEKIRMESPGINPVRDIKRKRQERSRDFVKKCEEFFTT